VAPDWLEGPAGCRSAWTGLDGDWAAVIRQLRQRCRRRLQSAGASDVYCVDVSTTPADSPLPHRRLDHRNTLPHAASNQTMIHIPATGSTSTSGSSKHSSAHSSDYHPHSSDWFHIDVWIVLAAQTECRLDATHQRKTPDCPRHPPPSSTRHVSHVLDDLRVTAVRRVVLGGTGEDIRGLGAM